MKSLQKNLTAPNKKIIATWPDRDKRVLHAYFGLKWPQHPKNKEPYKKIKDYAATDYPELEQTLYIVQRLIGVTNLIGNYEMEALLNYLGDEFADFNTIEINCAINLAMAGHLGIDERSKIHFNSFTPLFLSTILSAYRSYRLKIVANHNNEFANAEATKTIIIVTEPTPAEKFEAAKRSCINAFENFITDVPVAYMDKIYDQLNEYKIYTASREEQEKFEAKARENIDFRAKKETHFADVLKQITGGTSQGFNSLISEAKKLAVKALFTKYANNKEAFYDLFKINL